LSLAALGLLVVGCHRTPEEPAAATSTVAASAPPPVSASAASGPPTTESAKPVSDVPAGRCVRPTPAAPPPPVPPGPAPGCPPDPFPSFSKGPVIPIGFPGAGGIKLDAELVTTNGQIMRGLMFRKEMPEDHGMLFRLGYRDDHKFWMRNTCIPLDMLFIEDDGLIAGIEENVPTLNEDERGVGCPSSWVLEVNAGWARRHGVRAGQRMEIPDAARRVQNE
jgi:uncharacterized protein